MPVAKQLLSRPRVPAWGRLAFQRMTIVQSLLHVGLSPDVARTYARRDWMRCSILWPGAYSRPAISRGLCQRSAKRLTPRSLVAAGSWAGPAAKPRDLRGEQPCGDRAYGRAGAPRLSRRTET